MYNTIELLLDCKLVVKHQFGNHIAQFEKAFNNEYHEHLICQKCGSVEEFSDERLDDIVEKAKERSGFLMQSRFLYIYGICKSCQLKAEEGKDFS